MSSQASEISQLRKIYPCFLAVFVGTMDFFLIYPFIATLFEAGQYSLLPDGVSSNMRHFYLGLAIFVNPFFKMVGNPFIGELSDRFGKKKILCLCLLSLAIGLFLTGLGIQFGMLYLFLFGRVYAGFFSAVKPLTIAIISKISSKEKAYANISKLIAVAGISYAISPIFGGLVSDPNIVSGLMPDIAFYAASLLAIIVFF